jgi:hypothetical protein
MCKMRTILSGGLSIQWVLGAISVWSGACLGAANASSLIGWWKLDEPSGTVASDSSGQGNDGSLHGSAKHTAGQSGGGVYCDGTEAYVEIPGILTQTGTLAFWFKPDWEGTDPSDYWLFDASVSDKTFYIAKGGIRNAYFGFFYEDSGDADFQVTITAADVITAGTWYHVAATWEYSGGAVGNGILYLNGVEVARKGGLRGFPTFNSKPRFGYATGGGGVTSTTRTQGAKAVIDDIRLFDGVLAADEIGALMVAPVELASGPSPGDRGSDVPRDSALSWAPGVYAATHDIYFGTSYDDVNNATATSPVLVGTGQAATTYQPTSLFDFGRTYYWRVDEVNAPDRPATYKGNVWSFTAETYSMAITTPTKATASSQMSDDMSAAKTIDGSGLTGDQHSVFASDMWLSSMTGPQPTWIQYEFDRVYKLWQMWVWNSNQAVEFALGFGIDEAIVEYSLDGTTWTALADVPEFVQAPSDPTYVHDTTVDFGGVLAKFVKITAKTNWGGGEQYGLSEVRFFQVPTRAYGPTPAHTASGVPVNSALNWRPGREAVKHQVYLGADAHAVASGTAPVMTVTAHSLDLGALGLEYGRTYYWKVNEVNDVAHPEAGYPASWEGDLWSFSAAEYGVVDDFESYDNKCKRIFFTWVDGYGHSGSTDCGIAPSSGNDSGSTVGNTKPPFAEQTVVHGGRQAMPLAYDNTAGKSLSEATRTFDPAQDWTLGGAKTLVLCFCGDAANTPGDLYLKINDAKVTYGSGSAALSAGLWKQWNIDLTSVGTNLKAVKTLSIGVSGSGKGVLYVDDIRLYRTAPQL